jgi:hypothetical protein
VQHYNGNDPIIRTDLLDHASYLISQKNMPISREMRDGRVVWTFANSEEVRRLTAFFESGAPEITRMRRFAFARDDERRAVALMRKKRASC